MVFFAVTHVWQDERSACTSLSVMVDVSQEAWFKWVGTEASQATSQDCDVLDVNNHCCSGEGDAVMVCNVSQKWAN